MSITSGRRGSGCIISLMTSAGVPIITIPEVKSAPIFSMLVYSLVSFTKQNNNIDGKVIRYRIKDRILLVRPKNKIIVALYAVDKFEEEAQRFMETVVEIIDKIDSLVIEEGMIDGEIMERARASILNLAVDVGLPISVEGIYLGRIYGDLYGEIINKGADSSGLKGYFRVAYFPRLLDHKLLRSETEDLMKKILELCDGYHSIRYICKALGISEAKAYRFIAKLLRREKMILEIGFELIE